MQCLTRQWLWCSMHLALSLSAYLGARWWPGLTSWRELACVVMLAALCLGAASFVFKGARRLGALGLASWALGALLLCAHRLEPVPGPPALLEEASLCGLIIDGPMTTPTGWSVTMRPFEHPEQRVEVRLDGELWAQTRRARLAMPGDEVCVDGQADELPLERLPWERARQQLARWRGLSARYQAHALPRHLSSDDAWRWRIASAAASRRLALEARVRALLSDDEAAYILAMTLGAKRLLTSEQRLPFSLTGTSHILAISGLHLGFIAALLWFGLRALLRLSPERVERAGLSRQAAPLMIGALALYVLSIGAPTSALRALWMIIAATLAMVTRRRACRLHALATASTLLLLYEPTLVLDAGYQLSVSATLAILLTLERAQRPGLEHQRTWRRRLYMSVAVSWSAWLGTAPIILDLTRELPLSGLLLNLLIVPLVGALIFPMMSLGVALCLPYPALARWPLRAAAWMMEQLHALNTAVLEWPGAYWRPGHMGTVSLLLFGLAVWVWLAATRRATRVLATLCALSALLAPTLIAQHQGYDTLEFLPVGQGDATLLHLHQRKSVLLDGGGARFGADPGMMVVLPALRQRGIHRLDAVVLTHPDLDHIEGLFAIARWATPKRFYYNASSAADERLVALIAHLQARGSEVIQIEDTWTQLPLDQSLRLWRPPSSAQAQANDQSLTLIFERGAFRTALTGDLERAGERALLHAGLPKLTLWKLGHHGSKTSSAAALLARAAPAAAIVSCGLNNPHGHPHPTITARLSRAAIPLWRTDEQGLIHVKLWPNGHWRISATHEPAASTPSRGHARGDP